MDAIKKLDSHGSIVVTRIERELPHPQVLYRLTAYNTKSEDAEVTIAMIPSEAADLALFIIESEQQNRKNAKA